MRRIHNGMREIQRKTTARQRRTARFTSVISEPIVPDQIFSIQTYPDDIAQSVDVTNQPPVPADEDDEMSTMIFPVIGQSERVPIDGWMIFYDADEYRVLPSSFALR